MHTALFALGLNPMEQEIIDMTNEVSRLEHFTLKGSGTKYMYSIIVYVFYFQTRSIKFNGLGPTAKESYLDNCT